MSSWSSKYSSEIQNHINPLLSLFLPFLSSCSQPGRTKENKKATHRFPAWHSVFRVGLEHQMILGGSMVHVSALLHVQTWYPLECGSRTLTKPNPPLVHVCPSDELSCHQQQKKSSRHCVAEVTSEKKPDESCCAFLMSLSVKDLNLTEKYLEGFSLFQLALEGFGRLCVISPLGINKV